MKYYFNTAQVLDGIFLLARHLQNQEGYDGPLIDHSVLPAPLEEVSHCSI